MSAITTHVLDLSRGLPAAGVRVTLSHRDGDSWTPIAHRTTDLDGRIRDFLPPEAPLPQATYRLTFHTGEYFASLGIDSLHPAIDVNFQVRDLRHHHIPLLLTPFSYSTYRGS